jgi:hypothetical protein
MEANLHSQNITIDEMKNEIMTMFKNFESKLPKESSNIQIKPNDLKLLLSGNNINQNVQHGGRNDGNSATPTWSEVISSFRRNQDI